MALKNKLGLNSSAELANAEEKLTKFKAKELYDTDFINKLEVGTYKGLAEIHKYLFDDIYEFAGEVREVNIAKGGFRFAPVIYLKAATENIDIMPQSSFDEIVEKYVEMNVAHPFHEGNGRAARIWLDLIFKQELKLVIDWSIIEKDDYLSAMERSPIKDIEIKFLIKNGLVKDIDSREIYMKGIDQSYYYEGYMTYKTEEIKALYFL